MTLLRSSIRYVVALQADDEMLTVTLQAPVALDIRSPMDLVYECFVKLGLRYICVLRDGRYAGMVSWPILVSGKLVNMTGTDAQKDVRQVYPGVGGEGG